MGLEELRDAYRELFGEPFLVLPTDNMTDDEIAAAIRECIAKNEPYGQHLNPNWDY